MNNLEEKIIRVCKDNQNLFLYILVIGCVLFSYELVNFSLTIDEEIHIRLESAEVTWLKQGRWGMYLLSAMILPNPVIPTIPILIAILFSALAYIVIMRVFQSKNITAQYMAAPFFVGCPTLYYVYHFSTLSYGVGIGFFVSALGYYGYINNNKKIALLSILFFAFAISIYQAFLLFIAVLFLFDMFNRLYFSDNENIKDVLWHAIKFVGIILLSLILYFVITETSYLLFNINNNGYTSGFFNLTNSLAYWEKTIPATIKTMGGHYLGRGAIYGNNILSLAVLFLLTFSVIVVEVLKSERRKVEKINLLLVLLLIIVTPFLLNITNRGFMPTRALIAVPLVISGLVYFGWICSAKYMRYAIGLVAIAVIFQFSIANNKLAFANQLSWKADQQLAFRVQSRIDNLNIQIGAPVSLAVIGVPGKRSKKMFFKSQTVGDSFFSHEGGNIYRIIMFFDTLGISSYKAATLDERREIVGDVSRMPVWPSAGSVAVYNDILVIKFGDYTFRQRHDLCKSQKAKLSICSE